MENGCQADLSIGLFGAMEIQVHGESIERFRSRKVMWLLALLALREGRDIDRGWLAGTLWPDTDESSARHNLRQCLHDLRSELGSVAGLLQSDAPRSLRLDSARTFVDSREFDAAVRRGDPQSLELAIRLYRGPLLEECSEEWVLDERRAREKEPEQ